jgi:hypothetical protein
MSDEPKRSPAKAMEALERMALKDEGARVAKMSDAELDDALAARGVDAKAARERGAALAAKLLAAKGPPGQVVSLAQEQQEQPRRHRRAAWIPLVAAAAAIAAIGAGGAAYVALRTPEPAPTTPVPSIEPAPPQPPPEVLAKQEADGLRIRATSECAVGHWNNCVNDLDRAAQRDPGGDAARAVRRLRAKADRGIVAERLGSRPGALAPRTLAPDQSKRLVETLSPRAGQAIGVVCARGAEPERYCAEIAATLKKAGWSVQRVVAVAGANVAHGLDIEVATDADDATQDAADVLADAFARVSASARGPDDAPPGTVPLTLTVGAQ